MLQRYTITAKNYGTVKKNTRNKAGAYEYIF